MRKLRAAALAAAVLGSVSMVGAGVATAQEETPLVACTQTNGDTVETGDVDLPALIALTPGGGDADSRAQQNNCGVGVEENANTSGSATGGAAEGLLGL